MPTFVRQKPKDVGFMSKMMVKTTRTGSSIVLFALISLLCACGQTEKQNNSAKLVKIDTVKSVGGQETLQYPGKVKASDDVSLSFRVSGVLEKICVEDGQHVRQGQLLALLDSTDYRVQLDATEAQYSQVKAEAERIIALYEDNGVSANDYDKAVYGLQQATALLQHHRDQLAYTRLLAPFDGNVQKHMFEEKEAVGQGMPVVSMVGNGLPEVEVNLPASEYVRRDRFANFSCTVNVFPGRTYALRLISLAPKANANQLYTMRLQFTDREQALPSAGMNAMVAITCLNEEESMLSVPGSAVVKSEGRTIVFVYNPADGKAHSVDVSLVSLHSDGTALLTSGQLKPGDVIVSSGMHTIVDGQKVSPLPAPTSTNVGDLL